MHFMITFAVRKTVQQLLKYKDMNSDGGKMYFNKFLPIFSIIKVTPTQNSSSNWKLSVSHKADSTCTPSSTLPWQFIPAMIWKDQGWQSRVRQKVSSASQTFTSSHLLSKRLYCFTNTFLLFGSFWKLVLYWLHNFTTTYENIRRVHWFFIQHCLGQDPKW